MPKVSIIIPTYNRSAYLKETLLSIQKQSYTDYEIIITDNCSTDDTQQVVNSFDDPRIVYSKNEQNVGSVNNYNNALGLATGEFIHLFSDDDIMLSNCLEDKVAIFEEFAGIGILHSDINTIDKSGRIISDNHYSFKVYKKWARLHSVSRMFDKKLYHKFLTAHNFISMPAVMMRKEVLKKIGYFDSALSYIVDWQYWLKASLYFDFYYLNKKTISYRLHDTNTVKKLSFRTLNKEFSHIIKDLRENHKNKLIAKNDAQVFFTKIYYNGLHRHYYTNFLRWLFEFVKKR